MALLLEDLKDNFLYNKQVFLPIDEKNKKKGSLIYLLSPTIEETVSLINNNRFFRNPLLFESYYLEKDINLIINESYVMNEDRNPYSPSVLLSSYHRLTYTDSEDMVAKTKRVLDYGETGIVFVDSRDKVICWLIVNGSTIVAAYSIAANLEDDIMDFAVNTLHCKIAHKDLDLKYKKILKKNYDFTFPTSKDSNLNGPGVCELTLESAVLTEGVSRLDADILIWKAEAKITELIIKNFDNENWMKNNFKKMKSKLSKIPLPGFVDTIDDSLESLKDHLENQKDTIEFMTKMAALELKDEYDIADITKEYKSWIRSTKTSKTFKLKLIGELKDSYKETIKLYKYNIKRYEAQSVVEKRAENAVALVGKVASIFSFLTSGPLSPLKNMVIKGILPKSTKENVLSIVELKAKVAMYEKIIDELDELEDEIKAEGVNEALSLIDNEVITETLTAKERNKLKDSDFGLPAKRSYPMPDKSHVRSAIQMFNHVDKQDEKVLASAINRKIKEFDMEDDITISKKNRFYQYCPTSMREEVELRPIREDLAIDSASIRDRQTITFFESSITEDASYNKALRRVLYSERIRNQKEILLQYETIKAACPDIKKTFIDIKKYKSFNLYYDLSYYINSFVKNNYLRLDKSVNLLFELINRLLQDKRFEAAGYTKRTVFIPITSWKIEEDTDIWDYKFNINPVSIIHRLLMTESARLSDWGGIDFVFIGKNGFFKLDLSKFTKADLAKFRFNVAKLVDGSYIDSSSEPDNSKKGIILDILGRIDEPEVGIKVNNLTGGTKEITKDELKNKIDVADAASDDEDAGMDPDKEAIRKTKEAELIDKIDKAADAGDPDTAMKKLDDDDEFKQIVADLKMSSPNKVDYSPTRVARINALKDNFAKSKINKNKTVSDVLYSGEFIGNPLPETGVPIDSINEEWQHIKGYHQADVYDVNNDIYRVINHFSECTVPVAVRDYKVENTSTSEDTVDTWTVNCEDINSKRFTLKFDVPIVINRRFMKLRGNEKVMGTQLMNLPIIKTDVNTVQITTNYNKIFLSPYGNNTGKSYVCSDRIIKSLNKYEGKKIKVVTGDNGRICRKYDLPIDYIDLAENFMSISYTLEGKEYTWVFNQDWLYDNYGEAIKKDAKDNQLPVGYIKDGNKSVQIIYYNGNTPFSSDLAQALMSADPEFEKIYTSSSVSTRYAFSMASIMSSEIPVAVLCGYAIGLIPMMDRAGIKYEVFDKRPRYDKNFKDMIILSDAYIVYDLDYNSSMLMNGLKTCDTANYSIKEVNSSAMWLDFLDNFGGRIKSDGLDMFNDLLFDPITKEICAKYDLPCSYVDALLYANVLLSDNKYNKHTDITGNRYRNNEIIAAYTYKALATSYSQYRRNLKVGRDGIMTIKQSAVIDLIMLDNTESDYSSLSPLLEFEAANATSFKGLSGMNTDRSYTLDKRTYDKSMVNVLAMSTGFAANAGVNRQSTIDPNIDTSRGFIKSNPDKLSITNTFCMTEALTPYGVTSDDPFRTAMTFIQTSKHGMRTTIGDPLLVTTGADEALPYLTSDTFSFKAKGKGKIKEKTVDYMVIEYDKPIYDNKGGEKKSEVVDLREHMVKNSDGGFYQSLKLDTDYKVGDIVRKDDIVAIDKLSYNSCVGPTDNYAYNIGTFTKFAILMSDEGYEDSCRSTHWLAKAMSSTVVIEQEYNFNKDTNIYYLAKKGQQIQEGEPILIFQNAFDDEDANALIRALKDEDEEVVEELGRITLKSKVTGVVKDIVVRRCVDTEECSPTLQKIIKDYNKSVKDINSAYEKYDKDKAKTADPTYKLPATGKLKNSMDSVLITIYIAYQDDFGVSDKTVCYSALKGVSSKELIPEGKEAYSSYRPDEKVHYIQSEIGDMKRMVGSIYKIGALNKVLVETQRHMCDIMGIKWKYFDEY